MSARVGVDVGGTFTKAVACDAIDGRVLARSIVPTTHTATAGVAEGVVAAVHAVVDEVRGDDAPAVSLVAHSTTQAVNALLEADTAVVGVLGIGRRPDVRRARRRTALGDIALAPGRSLRTVHTFLDATDGLERRDVVAAIRGLTDAGAEVVCVSEAFGVDDARGEWLALDVAADLGVPACAGHELTGLYGLEMRTATAALNAGILPIALDTARLVEDAVARDAVDAPVLVMRGDGGAADLRTMKRRPLLTAFSGPAASVAGALRYLALRDAVVVEVGGTSTNVSVVKGGRPILSYVRVLEHVTSVRSLDVRVAGIAGGSLLRITRRLGRPRLDGVGPRSAHIAGLPYCSFASIGDLDGAVVRAIAPRPGDPETYLVLETPDGRRFAPTVTCAANAVGEVAPGSYARGNTRSARRAFELVGAALGEDSRRIAQRVVRLAATGLAPLVHQARTEHRLAAPVIVGVGGGAGAVVPALAAHVGTAWEIPDDAEIISSIGDALSLVRVEFERTLAAPTPEDLAALHREAQAAAVSAGAAPSTLQVESRAVPERGALRVAAVGSVALDGHSEPVDDERLALWAREELGTDAVVAARTDFYTVFTAGAGGDRPFVVLDRRAGIVAKGRGLVLAGEPHEVAMNLAERIHKLARHLGPIAVAPVVRIVRGSNFVDLSLLSSPERAVEAATAECALAGGDRVIALLSRE